MSFQPSALVVIVFFRLTYGNLFYRFFRDGSFFDNFFNGIFRDGLFFNGFFRNRFFNDFFRFFFRVDTYVIGERYVARNLNQAFFKELFIRFVGNCVIYRFVSFVLFQIGKHDIHEFFRKFQPATRLYFHHHRRVRKFLRITHIFREILGVFVFLRVKRKERHKRLTSYRQTYFRYATVCERFIAPTCSCAYLLVLQDIVFQLVIIFLLLHFEMGYFCEEMAFNVRRERFVFRHVRHRHRFFNGSFFDNFFNGLFRDGLFFNGFFRNRFFNDFFRFFFRVDTYVIGERYVARNLNQAFFKELFIRFVGNCVIYRFVSFVLFQIGKHDIHEFFRKFQPATRLYFHHHRRVRKFLRITHIFREILGVFVFLRVKRKERHKRLTSYRQTYFRYATVCERFIAPTCSCAYLLVLQDIVFQLVIIFLLLHFEMGYFCEEMAFNARRERFVFKYIRSHSHRFFYHRFRRGFCNNFFNGFFNGFFNRRFFFDFFGNLGQTLNPN